MYVDQPTVAQTVSILRGLRERYELHHGVKISDSALVEAAVLSDRYLADRFLPDKAIDLVDEAAAKLKMEITSKPEALDEIDRKVLQLEMERLSLNKAAPSDRAAAARLAALDSELGKLKEEQGEITAQWSKEKGEMSKLQDIKEEIERVNLEVQQAERDYDLNRWVVGGGGGGCIAQMLSVEGEGVGRGGSCVCVAGVKTVRLVVAACCLLTGALCDHKHTLNPASPLPHPASPSQLSCCTPTSCPSLLTTLLFPRVPLPSAPLPLPSFLHQIRASPF